VQNTELITQEVFMKKISLILSVVMIASVLLCSCGKEKPLPTFEELSVINSFEELFKSYDNVCVKTRRVATNPAHNSVQDTVYVKGEGKVDYYMRGKLDSETEYSEFAVRSGQEWYCRSSIDPLTAVLEIGESFTLDYTVPNFFDATPIGKAYMDNGQIVHHAFYIEPAMDEFDAVRYDYTYYFNAKTKNLERVEQLYYNHQHELLATYTAEFTYSVNVQELFGSTLKDEIYNSKNRIDLEIIVGHGTEEEKAYSMVATIDSTIYAVIDGSTYMLYTDAEYQNMAVTLDILSGRENATLYAYPLYPIE
jgi:hypothetical protein